MTADSASIVVVVPAHDAGWCIGACLDGLRAAGFDLRREVVVVDDGSTDDTAHIVETKGAALRTHPAARGAASARHTGVIGQEADIIAFVDADVVVAPQTKSRMREALHDLETAAVFGAYDTRPAAPGWVSQYRNLLHSYVHLNAAGKASTFWTGLGAVRRTAYNAVGGIDPTIRMMEDVDLGLRLSAAGYTIMLDPTITGTHLKAWGWRSMIQADVFDRAIPWAELLQKYKAPLTGLNLSTGRKIVALCAMGILFGLLMTPFHSAGLLLLSLSFVGFVLMSFPFLTWLYRQRGFGFAVFSLLPHLVHNWCAIVGIAWVKTRLIFVRPSVQ